MEFTNIVTELAIVFAGSAVFATVFLYLRQPVILAYILFGILIGPSALGLLDSPDRIEQLSHLGIILLLFLIGLNLQPERLLRLFGRISLVTLATSLVFLALGTLVMLAFGFSTLESLIVGAALMFSSTIVGLKLIPTTALHHRHMGEMMVSVLLLQDILAIVLILLLSGGRHESLVDSLLMLFATFIGVSVVAFALVRYLLIQLLLRFDTIREFIFMISLGWGLLLAAVAAALGLSYEIGAFIAGVSFASVPIAQVVAADLRPLRDFFLVMFFVAIGAGVELSTSMQVMWAAIVLSLVVVVLKPLVFAFAFRLVGEKRSFSRELGCRLGQASEFSLLLAYSAVHSGYLSAQAETLLQLVVILTFMLSTYWVVLHFRTPISSAERHRQD